MAAFQVVIGIDVETDSGSFYTTYEGMVKGTPELIRLLAGKGADATFFVTGAAAQAHPEIVRDVAEAGFEVGGHSLFHETVGEPIFEVPGVVPILPEEVPHRLDLTTQQVAKAAGYRPVSWRCPRLFGSTVVVRALEDLGYIADATLPLYHFPERLEPYHPSAEDWRRPGDLKLLEIPNFADLAMESHDPYGRDRDQWPIFRTQGAPALLQRCEAFVEYVTARGARPVLCFYFHPWEFVPMPESMFIGEGTVIPDPFILKNCGPYALEQFGLLVDGLQERGGEFVSARTLAETWEDAKTG